MTPINPQGSENVNQPRPVIQPSAPVQPSKAKEIPQDAFENIHSLPTGEIPDDFIARKIQEWTGEEFTAAFRHKRDDFNISCGFKPKGDEQDYRDMYTFNRNGEDYFGVKRFVTVEWKEEGIPKELTFSFNIELGLKVPIKKPGQSEKDFNNAMQQGMYMAGIAGKMSAEPWELMTKNRVGLASGEKWDQLKDQVDKIRKDRFVILELLHDSGKGSKGIKMNARDTFESRRIHQVIIHVRSAKSIASSEGFNTDNPPVDISSFHSNVYKSHALKGQITYADKFKPRKWHLSPEPLYSNQRETSAEVRQFATAQRLKEIRDEIKPGMPLEKVLHKKDLKPAVFEGSLRSNWNTQQKDLNGYLYKLSDRGGFQSLVNEFGGKNPPNLEKNPFILENFESVDKPRPSTPLEKLKAKLSPEQQPTPQMGKALTQLLNLLENPTAMTPVQSETLKKIADSSKQALGRMKEIDKDMKLTEDLLKKTLSIRNASDVEINAIVQTAKKRANTIEDFENLLAEIDQKFEGVTAMHAETQGVISQLREIFPGVEDPEAEFHQLPTLIRELDGRAEVINNADEMNAVLLEKRLLENKQKQAKPLIEQLEQIRRPVRAEETEAVLNTLEATEEDAVLNTLETTEEGPEKSLKDLEESAEEGEESPAELEESIVDTAKAASPQQAIAPVQPEAVSLRQPIAPLKPDEIDALKIKAESKKGDEKAQMRLAEHYESIKDFRQARTYYHLAAQKGNGTAKDKEIELDPHKFRT